MPLPEIQLDDRRFTELVEEAKRRIPGYTPEWTDHNPSDPGITLLQLFAWLTEMVLWRLNRVPDKNYIKFLELIGIQLKPPASARAELTFKLTTKDLGESVLVPKGTQVALSESVDGRPVIFETDDNLYAVGGELFALQSFDGAQYQLVTETNKAQGKFFFPFGPTPQAGAALFLGFDRPFPPGRHRLTLHAYTADLIEEGQGVNASITEPAPPVAAAWEYWNGSSWPRLQVIADTTRHLTRSGTLTFEAPTVHPANKQGLLKKEEDPLLHWLRYRIENVLGMGYEIVPRLEDVLLNTITGTNALTVVDELLGASDGKPNQTFRLANAPILPGREGQPAVVVEVDEGEGFERWTEVPDFSNSKRDDKHHTCDLSTGVIGFGSGERGKIPRWLVGDVPNIRAAFYRWGGGARGNAGADKITSLQTAVPYVDRVTNTRAAVGGEDEESLDQAKQRAPSMIRSRSRAVTASDFEFLATEAPGARIRRAKALPLRHPELELTRPAGAGVEETSIPIPGVVTVLVVPEGLTAKLIPSEETLALVGSWLNEHRLLTTELYVAAPRYRRVEIEARIIAHPTASSAQVAQALTRRLLDYFHPLRGGLQGTGWEFGGTIYFSETYRQILSTPGVARVEADALTTFIDGKPQARCSDVLLAADELVYSEQHTFFVSYA